MNDDSQLLRKIWWIASFPKSGNTLVRLFLNAYVTRFPLDINAHYQYACIDQQEQWYQHVAAKSLSDCHPMEIAYLRPAMLMHYIQVIAPRDACFKTHMAAVEVDGIPLIPPRLTKQAVYIVRDPRDVAVSYAAHSGKSIGSTINLMASNEHVGKRSSSVQDIILSWSSHVDSWLNVKAFPVMVVRYEDMVSDKEKTFRTILPALGFRRIDEAAFTFAMEQTEFTKLQRAEEIDAFREAKHDRFFRVGRSGYWRDVLSESQVEKIERNHHNSMLRCGYEPSLIGVS
jgi:aryl sulfotransferase